MYPHHDAPKGAIAGAGRHLAEQRSTGPVEGMRQTVGQLEPAGRQSQVAAAMERLGFCVDDMASVLSEVHRRLAPVTSMATDCEARNGAGVPAPVRCDLAFSIDAQSDRLCAFTQELRDLLNRLEV